MVDPLADEIKAAIMEIEPSSMVMTLMTYVDQCRELLRQNQDMLREMNLKGELGIIGSLLLQGGSV